MSPLLNEGTDLALRFSSTGGQTLVLSSSPLTRLNYFDGKFLRADSLRLEQAYIRQLVQFSNQGLGAGVVYGMDTTLDDQGRLAIGPGLAMDSLGRPLLVPSASAFDIAKLIDASRRIALSARMATSAATGAGADFGDCIDATTGPGTDIGQGASLYLICIGHAESLCGTEDVYGRLCEEACITATDRPYIVEGVIVRALPLTLRTAFATSKVVALGSKHLRSLVASAFFEDERHVVESMISRAGLSLDVWCMGAEAAAVGCVPLGVFARSGSTTAFLDAWTARRERIEAPARRYWAWRMAMRPWDVYLAQILQFQCQLHEILGGATDPSTPPDPCDPQRKLLDEASGYLKQVDETYARYVSALSNAGPLASNLSSSAQFQLKGGATDLASLRSRIDGALKLMIGGPQTRVLITGGIVELPPAGYLPVVPGTVSVNTQVGRLMGEGVDLRFCVVRPDFVAHALEEAQHMERISLISGLDSPTAKPEVDILVPNGDILTADQPALAGFDTQVRLNSAAIAVAVKAGESGTPTASPTAAATTNTSIVFRGASRGEQLSGGGGTFYFAGGFEAAATKDLAPVVDGIRLFAVGSAKTRNDIYKRASGAPAPADDIGVAPPIADSLVSRYVLNAGVARKKIDEAALSRQATVGAVRTPNPALISMWATMRSERDPYTLGTADATSMSGEIVLASQVTSSAGTSIHFLVRVRVFGTFTATQLPIDTPTGKRMVGHITGAVSTQTMEESNPGTNHAMPFDAEVTLVRSGDSTAARLRAALTGTRLVFVTDATWGGNPLAASFKLSLGVITPKADSIETLRLATFTPPTVELLSANLVASADALKEGSALRMLSTAAIELIGEELTRANQGGAAFVDAAQRSLFPPPPEPVDTLTIRPTMDWVLFHRRRTKTCATPSAAPPTSPSRRYQVYEALANGPRDVADIRAALRTPDGITKIDYRRVDVVEFAGGLSTLLSTTSVLLQDWTAVQPGNRLVYGAIATPVTTDTPPLEDARLSRVVQALAPVSSVDPVTGSTFETLPQVPAALAVPGTDGIIFLVTEAIVATTCQDVYRVIETADILRNLVTGKLGAVIASMNTQHIASVEFANGSNTPTDASKNELQQAWSAAGGGATVGAIAYPNPSDTSGGDPSIITPRATAILAALGPLPGTGTVATKIITASQWPSGPTCPVVTFVIIKPARIVRVIPRTSVAGALVRPSPDLFTFTVGSTLDPSSWSTETATLQTLVSQQKLAPALNVEYVFGDGTAADAQARLNTIMAALKAIINPALVVPTVKSSVRPLTANDTFVDPGEPSDDYLVLQAG